MKTTPGRVEKTVNGSWKESESEWWMKRHFLLLAASTFLYSPSVHSVHHTRDTVQNLPSSNLNTPSSHPPSLEARALCYRTRKRHGTLRGQGTHRKHEVVSADLISTDQIWL